MRSVELDLIEVWYSNSDFEGTTFAKLAKNGNF